MENGKKIQISAPENSDKSRSVQEVKYNGKNYSKNFLVHSSLLNGADIQFRMGDKPNKKRGINKADYPYSLSNEK